MFENIAIGSLFVVCMLGLCIVYLKVKDDGHWTSKLESFRPSAPIKQAEDDEYRYYAACLECGISVQIPKPNEDSFKPTCGYCKEEMKIAKIHHGKTARFNIKKKD